MRNLRPSNRRWRKQKQPLLGYAGCAISDLGQKERGVEILKQAVDIDPSNAQATWPSARHKRWLAISTAELRACGTASASARGTTAAPQLVAMPFAGKTASQYGVPPKRSPRKSTKARTFADSARFGDQTA